MKKTLSAIIVLLICISTLIISFGEENVKMSIFTIDEKKMKLPIANVTFDGNKLNTDVAPFILDDRTLVPVRVISENVGANIAWDSKKRQVTIKKDSKTIVLTINSPKVSVNGVLKNLPDNVPPKIANDRTMIPVRFVSEELGVNVGWNQDTKTVALTKKNSFAKLSTFKYENNKLTLNLDKENLKYESIKLIQPDRLVLDIKDSVFNLSANEYGINKDNIDKLRFSQFQANPPIARLVVDMKANKDFKIYNEGKNIIVEFKPDANNIFDGGNIETPVETPVEKPAEKPVEKVDEKETSNPTDSQNPLFQESDEEKYVQVKLEESKSIMKTLSDSLPTDKLGFMFLEESKTPGFLIRNGMNASKYKSFYLADPQRLVFDFYGMSLDGNGYIEQKLDRDFIDSYRSYYYEQENRTRLVITLKDHVFRERLKIQEGEGNIIIFQNDSEIKNKNMQYKYYGGYSSLEIIQDISEEFAEKEYSEYENILKLKVKSENINMISETMDIDDKFIKKMEIDVASKYSYIYLYLKENSIYNIVEDGSKGKMIIEIKEKKVESGKKLIVIDPGHGGIKPGAISPIDKTVEKNLALSTSKHLQSILLSRGYDVYMIRNSDEHVDNYERTHIANEKNATLYISIHFNSINNAAITGIETLYFPSDNMNNLEEKYRVGSSSRDNKTLAKKINDAIIKETGAKNRGIVPRPELIVTRETIMPAVLVEGGFMTNQAELQKIKTSAYQEKIAKGIADGIDQFIKNIK